MPYSHADPGPIDPVAKMTSTTSDVTFTQPPGVSDTYVLQVFDNNKTLLANRTFYGTVRSLQQQFHTVFKNLIPNTTYQGVGYAYSKGLESVPTNFKMTTGTVNNDNFD